LKKSPSKCGERRYLFEGLQLNNVIRKSAEEEATKPTVGL
jgi:hypothetical protein